MSRKSRERREKNKAVRPDDYFSNGTFEMARFRKTTIVRNNRTPEQHAAQMEYLRTEYASKYEDIAQKVKSLKEKVTQCDPYSLLMYLRSLATMGQMNIFSEIEYSSDANAIIRAQEYVQSIFVSTENNYVPSEPNEEAALHAQIVADFDELYKDFRFFYHFWAAHIQKSGKIGDSRLNEIVESQYMYWVRGNRYQIFELEPLKSLLPPHNDVLLELFGVSSAEVIEGLEKLRYSLSQGYADAIMELGKEFELAAAYRIPLIEFNKLPFWNEFCQTVGYSGFHFNARRVYFDMIDSENRLLELADKIGQRMAVAITNSGQMLFLYHTTDEHIHFNEYYSLHWEDPKEPWILRSDQEEYLFQLPESILKVWLNKSTDELKMKREAINCKDSFLSHMVVYYTEDGQPAIKMISIDRFQLEEAIYRLG